jgi:myo-inositol-1(or 4)-monophosphatase
MPEYLSSRYQIALEREGQLVSGLVFNPVSDELYLAEKGHGSLSQRPPARRGTEKSFRDFGWPRVHRSWAKTAATNFWPNWTPFFPRPQACAGSGAASLDLASVAAGRCDAFWERNLQAWDVAAGILLVREAGGAVSDLEGRDKALSGDILATNEHLQRPLLQLLRGANRKS